MRIAEISLSENRRWRATGGWAHSGSVTGLRRAKAIDIVMVADGRTKDDEVPGVEIGNHLARHGTRSRVSSISAAR
jgi:hypothetical protein